jgi:hypothetical protein
MNILRISRQVQKNILKESSSKLILEDLSISEAGLQLIIARDLISLKMDKSLALLGNKIKNS